MRIKVLGSAAGGGFPQWNCACPNCTGFRDGRLRARPRSQAQLAFTPDEKNWFLLGASPDLRSQLLAAPELAPSSEEEAPFPIGGVFLPSADVDSVMGLLHLREFQTFFVFSTPAIQRVLQKENRIFSVLNRAETPVRWVSLSSKNRLNCHLSEDPGAKPEFSCATIPLGGAFPDYVSEELVRNLPAEEATSGFVIEQGDKRFFYAPSSGHQGQWQPPAEVADVVFLDATFWSDDELIRTGRSKKTAREIGHVPLDGPGGLLEQYPNDAKGRKILFHINNTNPILNEDSAEHRAVLDAGFEIAYDGMEIAL
ncbi:MAG TPA: MBL fold metallo-hydrolase [Candidatus Saccharimonadales bacterium]|nr:MBL fold metallo-hydrolase [Candidatus Saccharimonadales bacterium]